MFTRIILPFQTIILFLSWIIFSGYAQDFIPKFERFSLKDGLPTSPIAGAPVQDPNGFIWFGTWNGLYKYDGYTFQGYWHNPEDSLSLSHNWAMPYITRNGALWAGTAAGLDRFNALDETFTRFSHDSLNPSTIGSGSVDVILEDKQGRFWVGTANGLNLMDRQSGHFTRFSSGSYNSGNLFGNQVREIFEDDQGTIWIGTGNPFSHRKSGGLNRLNEENNTFDHFLVNPDNPLDRKNFVQAIYQPTDDEPWVATWEGGLYRFDRQEKLFLALPPLQYPVDENRANFHGITWMCSQPGTPYLWMATFRGGLNRYNVENGENSFYLYNADAPFSIADDRIWSVFIDADNLLWIGTHSGLNKTDLSGKFPTYRLNLNPEEGVTDILEDEQGVIWLGTSDMRLLRWDRENQQIDSFRPPAGGCTNWDIPGSAMAQAQNGSLLFSSNCGLFQFDPIQVSFQRLAVLPDPQLTVKSDRPIKMLTDRHNTLWISADPLTAIDLSTGKVTQYKHDPEDENSINENDIETVFEDKFGNIWIGTINGLAQFQRETGQFTRMLEIKNGQRIAVTDISADSAGIIYLSTDTDGLVILDPASRETRKFSVQEGMHTSSFYNIINDQIGNAWLFSPTGITRFNTSTIASKFFDQNDGLVEMTYLRHAAYCSKNGEILLGGRGAVNFFDPEAYQGSSNPPRVILTGLQVAGELPVTGSQVRGFQPAGAHKRMILSHTQNDITFDFVALDYRNPHLNQYQYQLENYEKAWVQAGTQRNARYTNLDPGDYTFRARAANSNGIWSIEDTVFQFRILKPWWATWWAYLLYGLVFGAIVLAARKYETDRIRLRNQLRLEQIEAEKLKEVDQMKSHFFANISHEFRTPLTVILGQINAVTEAIKTPKAKDKLQVAKRNSHRLLNLVNQLLDLSQLESGAMSLNITRSDILPFLKYLLYSFESMADEKNISLHWKCEEKQIVVDLEPDKLEKIIVNLLSNAIKFTPEGGKVSLQLSVNSGQSKDKKLTTDNSVAITVSDTGSGIPREQLPHIFGRFYQVHPGESSQQTGTGIGLALVKELVELHKGSISVASQPGEGSVFTIILPLEQEHLQTDTISEDEHQPKFSDKIEQKQNVRNSSGPPEIENPDSEFQIPNSEFPDILLVEDNADIRNYIRENLEAHYQVKEAADGEEGLKRAQKIIPDLIISDIMMPRMDGYEFSRQIRADEKTSHIPIIMLTAKASQSDKISGLEIGVDDYLIKPFDAEELQLRIRNLIRLRRQMKERFSTATIIRPTDVSAISADQKFLQRILDIIEAQMGDDNFSVEALARQANMSEPQLNRKLNALINQPPGKLIRSLRLQRAADLLQQGAGNVAEIAYEVGFSDQANFTRSFKKQFGVTPSKYKTN